jgi:DNA recombination protein RmuC
MEAALLVLAVALVALCAALAWKLHGAGLRVAESEAQAKAAGMRLDEAIEALRREVPTAAKAGALEAAQALSKQLIDEHKRETTEAEARAQQVNAALVKQVDDITKAVTALNTQLDEKGRVLDKVWRSLTSPGGSGQIAEIGLANALKSFGLEEGRDFELQATTTDETGRRLRPDALVFLPANSALVIDCKASKYLLEIAEAEGAKDEEAAYANLARTMNGHLRALDDKDYRGAVLAAWRAAGKSGELAHVLSIMYLPNEAVLEKLARADAGFFARARAAEIIPAGPAGLNCALSLAAAGITKERQAENQQRIVEGAQNLLEAVATAIGFASGVGKGIKAAAESFEKFTKSVNGRLLPRAQRLAKLGVQPPKALPGNLPAYAVMSQESDQLIEGEAEEVDEPEAATAAAPRRLVAD